MIKYFNDSGKDVTNQIVNKHTIFTESLLKAKQIAEENGSYYYEVYSQKEGERKEHAGYGIPK